MGIRNRLFPSMLIRILLLIKVMRICDHWPTHPLGFHCKPPRLHFELPRPFTALFWASKLLNFAFNADPDPAFHSYADPDPLSKTMRIRWYRLYLFARELSQHSVHFFIFISLPSSIKQRRIEMNRNDSLIHTASLTSSGFRVHWPEMDLWWWPPA